MTEQEAAGAPDVLVDLRHKIDDIDDKIINLLAQRAAVAQEVAQRKVKHGLPVVVPDRIEVVRERNVEIGRRHGLNRRFIESLYHLIVSETCLAEYAEIENLRSDKG